MNKNGLIISFDIGTQSMRGMLISNKGKIEAFEQFVYDEPYYSKSKDWAEKNPDFYYETLCKISKLLKKKNKKLFDRVVAVTTTVFRDSTICLDENNKPLRDMILWLDKREIESDELPIPAYKKAMFSLVGVKDVVDTQHRQSVCNYIMLREPIIWAKTKKYVVLSTYINYKMTGLLIDSAANQIAHMPFDYKNSRWSSKNDLTRCIYDIPEDKLCDLCEPGAIIGNISKACQKDSGLSEIPYIVTGSDKGCETIGLSVTSENKAAVSFGTSATIQFTTPNYFEPQAFCPAYPSPIKGLFNPEYQVYRGYWMLSWFKKTFVSECEFKQAQKMGICIEDYFNRHLNDVAPGSDGLIMQPHFSPGVANPNAKGAIIGWSDVQSKYHIYKAIIEGINYELMYGLYKMSNRGKKVIRELYVGGGGSQSNEICQLCADMFGLPVKRIQTHEACGLGSAIVGFISLGIYSDLDEAINNMVQTKDIFEPDMIKHEFYYAMYKKVYSKLARRLVPLYKTSKQISKGVH